MTLNVIWYILFVVIIAGYLILDGFRSRRRHFALAGGQERHRTTPGTQQYRSHLGR